VDEGLGAGSLPGRPVQRRHHRSRQDAAGAYREHGHGRGSEVPRVPGRAGAVLWGSEGDAPSRRDPPAPVRDYPSPLPADLPRPEPWGSLDQVCTSNPPPKLSSSWARRGFCEGNCTTWVQMKAALSKAPGNERRKQSLMPAALPAPAPHRPQDGPPRHRGVRTPKGCWGSTARPCGRRHLTRRVWLAVVLQVLQLPAHQLCHRLAPRRPAEADEAQLRLADSPHPGADGPAPVHQHRHVHHGPPVLIRDGGGVAPAACRGSPSASCATPTPPTTTGVTHGGDSLTGEVQAGRTCHLHPAAQGRQLGLPHGDKLAGGHHRLPHEDLLGALVMPSRSHQQSRARERGMLSLPLQLPDCADHRIPEWWGLEGTSGDPSVQPPVKAGSPRAGCTAPRPGGA